MSDGFKRLPVCAWQAGTTTIKEDTVAAEVPVALVYNDISHAVMMATPTDLEPFAYGFSLTEGIIDQTADVYSLDVAHHSQGIELQLRVSSRVFNHLKERRRHLTGRTGCGLCGVESLDQVQRALTPVTPEPIAHEAIQRAVAELTNHQPLFDATGAVHGAAWCTPEGAIQFVMEDVGRHNALDKLIGQRLLTTADVGFALLSSRASFEMVQKCIVAGIPNLISVSGATQLVVTLAHEYTLNLVGFARNDRHVVYNA